MATAEEILQANPEGHIVVGGDRFITVPKNLKRLAVQYDHNMETVTFDCPRYWDDQDMSKMVIYVNYTRSDGEGGTYSDRYPVGLPTVDANNDKIMHFNWTISRNVTEVAGPIVFLVCVQKTGVDENGKAIETNHWNSELCEDCYISPGMETEENAFNMYPDETTQLLERMLVVEAAKAEMESMLTAAQTAKGDAQTAQRAAEAAKTAAGESAAAAQATLESVLEKDADIRNSYANAIRGNVSGEVIRVDDVSPIEHDVKLLVHGKNLFDISKLPNIAGKLTNNNDGTLTVAANQYAVPTGVNLTELCPSLNAGDVCTLSFSSTSTNTKYIWLNGANVMLYNATYTFTYDMLNSELYLYGFRDTDEGYGSACTISSIQVEKGTVATTYEPYIDPTTTSVVSSGTNLINCANYTSQKNGFFSNVTLLESNDTGTSITIQGAAGKSSCANSSGWLVLNYGRFFNLEAGTEITISADVTLVEEGIYGKIIKFAIINNTVGLTLSTPSLTLGNKQRFTWTKSTEKDGIHRFVIMVNTNKIKVENIMVSLNGDTSYKEYRGYVTIPDSAGSCTIASIDPTMTILTTTPGVTIEAEYNRDTTKSMTSYIFTEEIKNEIAAMVESDMAEVLASLNSYATSLIGGDA